MACVLQRRGGVRGRGRAGGAAAAGRAAGAAHRGRHARAGAQARVEGRRTVYVFNRTHFTLLLTHFDQLVIKVGLTTTDSFTT